MTNATFLDRLADLPEKSPALRLYLARLADFLAVDAAHAYAPVEQPVRPAVAEQAPAAPAVAPQPVEQPTAAPIRQIIIIKQADNPAAAPIVIDRGTKRRSP